MKLHRLLIITVLLGYSVISKAQVDTIGIHGNKLITANLKPGLRQYLVYTQDTKDNRKLGLRFWVRNIRLESRQGQKVFTISQQWFGPDTSNFRKVYSINEAADFSPVFHAETIKGINKSYNWYPTKVTGTDTIATNSQKLFSLEFTAPNYNWNLDIETFEMLPLAKGRAFAINFYDAGLSPPKYILYRVTGDEIITTYDNQKIDCWKLVTEGTRGSDSYSETFWISKKGHEFLKEEDRFGNNYRYKIKMPAAVPDFLKRFVN